MTWKEYCVEYWLKEPQESMGWYTGHCNITEILLKTVLNTIQSITVYSVQDLRIRSRFPSLDNFFPWIDDSHCEKIHSSLTADLCFDDCYVGKQPVAWKEYCAEYW